MKYEGDQWMSPKLNFDISATSSTGSKVCASLVFCHIVLAIGFLKDEADKRYGYRPQPALSRPGHHWACWRPQEEAHPCPLPLHGGFGLL